MERNRATYHNLKKSTALNALTQYDIQKLWLPEVIYENTDQKESTRIGEFGAGEWKTNVVVKREEENGILSGVEFVDETEFFSGSENSLIMNQTYTHNFQCNYELSYYPFDTQVRKGVKFFVYSVSRVISVSLSDLHDRHGNGKFVPDHSDSRSGPNDYEPKTKHANLSKC